MDFFSKCSSKEEAKTLFRKLSKLFHPDHNGDPDLMIELMKQYDNFDKPKVASCRTMNYRQERNVFNEYEKLNIQNEVLIRLMENRIESLQDQNIALEKIRRTFAYMPFTNRLLFLFFKDKFLEYILRENEKSSS